MGKKSVGHMPKTIWTAQIAFDGKRKEKEDAK